MPTLKPLGTLLNAPDYADRVNLIKKIKTASGWRFASVVPEANGRLKDRVRINGQLEVHAADAVGCAPDNLAAGVARQVGWRRFTGVGHIVLEEGGAGEKVPVNKLPLGSDLVGPALLRTEYLRGELRRR